MAEQYYPTFHPVAAIFPLLEGQEFNELVESIRAHGLREPIKLYEGQVIDGRNRLTACRVAGVEPRFEEAKVNGSVADYVYDMNFHRRHLTEGGRALSASRYQEEVEKEKAASRQKTGKGADGSGGRGKKKNLVEKLPPGLEVGKARDVAGAAFKVSGKTVDGATKVLKKAAPEVVKAVERGELKVSTAARLAEAPKSVQVAAVQQGKAAVRAAIEKHAPSVNEEARNDPGVRWHKAMHDICVRLRTTREAGGAKELCRQWTEEQRIQYVTDLREFIEEFQQWIEVLKVS